VVANRDAERCGPDYILAKGGNDVVGAGVAVFAVWTRLLMPQQIPFINSIYIPQNMVHPRP
jgi:hypothetical protein